MCGRPRRKTSIFFLLLSALPAMGLLSQKENRKRRGLWTEYVGSRRFITANALADNTKAQ